MELNKHYSMEIFNNYLNPILEEKKSLSDFILTEKNIYVVVNNTLEYIDISDSLFTTDFIKFCRYILNSFNPTINYTEYNKQEIINKIKEVSSINTTIEYNEYRFRCNLFVASNEINCVLRKISSNIHNFEELGFTREQMLKLLNYKDYGLLMISGVTGSGKSTTAASILDYYNEIKPYHIITIEDPIEYKLKNKKSKITQREVGLDTPSFKQALKDSLRQKPNILFIGEIRDLEVAEIMLQAALTGHLVITTIHASSIIQSINRFIGLFPIEQEFLVKKTFAHILLGCISQKLVYNPMSKQNKLEYEMLIADDTAKMIIQQDKQAYGQLKDIMRRQGNKIFFM
jgi:twitching motility protein PilT